MSQPFARAIAMMALISQALSPKKTLPPLQYPSRGPGRGVYPGKGRGNPSGKVYPFYSDRECNRRMKQMEAGKLAWNKSGCW